MIFGIFLILHIIVSACLIIVILMQASKGKGLAGAFGGGGGGFGSSMFGARGTATFLSKMTTYLASAFFVLSLVLSLLSTGGKSTRSVVQEAMQTQGSAINLPVVPGSMEELSGKLPETMPFESQESQEPAGAPIEESSNQQTGGEY
ncbi:preprotein translocase subunit SecG [bacterium]|nr:preprotein translocase subunit SecG [bacterium]